MKLSELIQLLKDEDTSLETGESSNPYHTTLKVSFERIYSIVERSSEYLNEGASCVRNYEEETSLRRIFKIRKWGETSTSGRTIK